MYMIEKVLNNKKIFIWIAVATLLILAIPLIAMQFTSEVNWSLGDFIIMGVLIFGMTSLFVVVARKFSKYAIMLAVIFVLLLVYIWAELAVGVFTNIGS